jgi:hypothetical protein
MRQFLAATALAFAIVTPAIVVAAPAFAQAEVYGQNSLSPDPEIRSYQEFQRLAAHANADRLQNEQQEQQATQHAAISNGATATDAAIGSQPAAVGTAGAAAGMIQTNSCPGTNEAGQPWHAGEYCLPGGR